MLFRSCWVLASATSRVGTSGCRPSSSPSGSSSWLPTKVNTRLAAWPGWADGWRAGTACGALVGAGCASSPKRPGVPLQPGRRWLRRAAKPVKPSVFVQRQGAAGAGVHHEQAPIGVAAVGADGPPAHPPLRGCRARQSNRSSQRFDSDPAGHPPHAGAGLRVGGAGPAPLEEV